MDIQQNYKIFEDYFDQNPLCQLGVIVTRDGIAEKISDLTSKYITSKIKYF